MHVRRWSLVSAVLALSGCQKSALNPNDPVSLDGTLKDSAGAPLANKQISLGRYNPAVSGGACLLVPTGDSNPSWAKATTDAAGKYHFDLKGSDTQSGDLARCFQILNPGDAAGRGAGATFIIQVTQVEVPELKLWQADTQASLAAGAIGFTWKSLASGAGVAAKSQHLALTSAGATLWVNDAAGDATSLNLPTYLLEDQQAKAQVVAFTETKGSGVIFQLSFDGEKVDVPGTVGLAPPSRGAACSAEAAGLPATCPFTDGRFQTTSLSSPSVTLTLGSPLLAKRALLRDLDAGSPVVIEASEDGTTFTAVARTSSAPAHAYLDLPLSTTAPAKFFRVRADGSASGDGKLRALAQVSLLP